MIEIIAALALSFGAGYFVGHEKPTVSCLDNAQITATCTDIEPPSDDSFGATTESYHTLIKKYRQCKAVCTAAK